MEKIQLADCCSKITDFVASGSFASLRENVKLFKTKEYALLVKTADFANDFTKDLTYTDKHGYDFLENSHLEGGELILSNIGSIGKVFICPKLNERMTLASNSIMVRANNNFLNKYLYYFFQSPYGQRELLKISTGTSMKKFNKTELKKVLVPKLRLEDQISLVTMLDEINNLISLKNEQLLCFDNLIFSKFNSLFSSVKESCPLINLTDKVTDGSHLPPKGIDKSDYLMLSSQNVWDDLDLKEPRYITKEDFERENQRTSIKKGDVLLTIVGTIGRTYVVKENDSFVFQRSVAVIKPKNNILNGTFLAYYLKSAKAQNDLKNNSHGTSQSGIYLQDLKSLIVPKPDYSLQCEFEEYVNKILNMKTLVKSQLKNLNDLYNSKMKFYFDI